MLNSSLDYDKQLEQIVLGRLLVNEELLKTTSLFPECFSEGYHRELFSFMRELEKRKIPINAGTVYGELGKDNAKVGGFEYLMKLTDSVETTEDFEFHEKNILINYKYIQSNRILQQLQERKITFGQAGMKISALEGLGIDEDDGDVNKHIDTSVERLYSENNGIKTKFDEYDKLTKGFRAGELVILGARPSVGKTAFALNLANNVARSDTNKDGVNVALFSLEMDGYQNIDRLQSMNTGVHLSKIHDAVNLMNEEEFKKANFGYQYLRSTAIRLFDNPSVTVFDIWAKVRKMRLQLGDDEKIVVIIDYLQLISSGKGNNQKENRNQEISEISRTLKIMARDLKVCVVALSQLSRGVESREDKRPKMNDLRESGSIEQDADVIGLLYRDDYYNKETEKQNIIELIIAKNRSGATGTVQLYFEKEIGKVRNISYK